MLKNILRLLLSKFYSRKESELVGHQAMPSENYITLFEDRSIDGWGALQTGVAAYDGYLRLTGQANNNSASSLSITANHLISTVPTPTATSFMSICVPIRKGASWSAEGFTITNARLYLIKTLGTRTGGGIRLLNVFCKEVTYA